MLVDVMQYLADGISVSNSGAPFCRQCIVLPHSLSVQGSFNLRTYLAAGALRQIRPCGDDGAESSHDKVPMAEYPVLALAVAAAMRSWYMHRNYCSQWWRAVYAAVEVEFQSWAGYMVLRLFINFVMLVQLQVAYWT